MSIYEENGYYNREDYLETMADVYGVPFDVVVNLADMFGESEDFDGLITALEDYDVLYNILNQ